MGLPPLLPFPPFLPWGARMEQEQLGSGRSGFPCICGMPVVYTWPEKKPAVCSVTACSAQSVRVLVFLWHCVCGVEQSQRTGPSNKQCVEGSWLFVKILVHKTPTRAWTNFCPLQRRPGYVPCPTQVFHSLLFWNKVANYNEAWNKATMFILCWIYMEQAAFYARQLIRLFFFLLLCVDFWTGLTQIQKLHSGCGAEESPVFDMYMALNQPALAIVCYVSKLLFVLACETILSYCTELI